MLLEPGDFVIQNTVFDDPETVYYYFNSPISHVRTSTINDAFYNSTPRPPKAWIFHGLHLRLSLSCSKIPSFCCLVVVADSLKACETLCLPNAHRYIRRVATVRFSYLQTTVFTSYNAFLAKHRAEESTDQQTLEDRLDHGLGPKAKGAQR